MKLLVPKSPGSGEGRMVSGWSRPEVRKSPSGSGTRRVVFRSGTSQKTENCGFGCHLCRFQGPTQKSLESHMRTEHNFATEGKYTEALWKYVVTEPGGTYRDLQT